MKNLIVICLSIFLSTQASAQINNKQADEFYGNGCRKYPVDEIKKIIDIHITNMKLDYGKIANDSLESLKKQWTKKLISNTFFMPIIEGVWTPEPYETIDLKLKSLFTEGISQTDSIDNLCRWIGSKYPFGDSDIDSNYLYRSPDSSWKLMQQGNLQGLCGELSAFFSNIVNVYYPHWGYPITFISKPDSSIKGVGTNPSHIWVGLANRKGEIWAVCDPTLGGVVRDSKSGIVLSLSKVRESLSKISDCEKPTIKSPLTSINTWGNDCVFSTMARNSGPNFVYYPNLIEIVEGPWIGLEAATPLCAPYWAAKKYPRMTFMNVYLDIIDLYSHGNQLDNTLMTNLKKEYLIH